MNTEHAVLYPYDRPTLGHRIAQFISKTLDIPLRTSIIRPADFAKKVVFLVNSNYAFANQNWMDQIAQMCAEAEQFVFVQNDYAYRPPVGRIMDFAIKAKKKNVVPIYWTTVPYKIERNMGTYINWNVIGWDEEAAALRYQPPKINELIYYGDFRPGRKNAIREYFGPHASYQATISAPQTSFLAYEEIIGKNSQVTRLTFPIPLFHRPSFADSVETLRDWRATIYIEDEYSHEHYTSPSTRWFEGLSAGIAQFVDKHAAPTLIKGGFDVDSYTVNNSVHLANVLPYAEEIARRQRREFNQPFLEDLKHLVLKAWEVLPTLRKEEA